MSFGLMISTSYSTALRKFLLVCLIHRQGDDGDRLRVEIRFFFFFSSAPLLLLAAHHKGNLMRKMWLLSTREKWVENGAELCATLGESEWKWNLESLSTFFLSPFFPINAFVARCSLHPGIIIMHNNMCPFYIYGADHVMYILVCTVHHLKYNFWSELINTRIHVICECIFMASRWFSASQITPELFPFLWPFRHYFLSSLHISHVFICSVDDLSLELWIPWHVKKICSIIILNGLRIIILFRRKISSKIKLCFFMSPENSLTRWITT